MPVPTRCLPKQTFRYGGDVLIEDVHVAWWSLYAQDGESDDRHVEVGYSSVGPELILLVRRERPSAPWSVVRAIRTDQSPSVLAAYRVEAADPRPGDHLELVFRRPRSRWTFCTVREVADNKVSVVERGVKRPEVVRHYSKVAFRDRWLLLSNISADGQEAKATSQVVCATCSRRRVFFAPAWSGVRCDGCGDFLPDSPEGPHQE
jgi:hypothetical protein